MSNSNSGITMEQLLKDIRDLPSFKPINSFMNCFGGYPLPLLKEEPKLTLSELQSQPLFKNRSLFNVGQP